MALEHLTTMRKLNEQFGREITRVMEEHGLSLRAQRPRTGLSHVTVQGMMNGIVPQMESVVAFAKGFGMDVNALLELAGYPPIEDGSLAGAERLLDGLTALEDEYPDRRIPVPRMKGGVRGLTVEQADAWVANTRELLERGIL